MAASDLTDVRRASARLRDAEAAWNAALVAARNDGASLRDLADASDTTHTRVRRILDADRASRRGA